MLFLGEFFLDFFRLLGESLSTILRLILSHFLGDTYPGDS